MPDHAKPRVFLPLAGKRGVNELHFWGARQMKRTSALIAFVVSGASIALADPAVQWVTAGGDVVVEITSVDQPALESVREWPAQKWSTLLYVLVHQEGALPMLGTWAVHDRAIRFTPKFPLTAGVKYRAVFEPSKLPGGAPGAAPIISEHAVPAIVPGQPTVVSQIYPSGDVVPENLLKFYLHFSAPMSRGNIYDHIHLRNEKGEDVELPFLEINEELWNEEMTRLTLFIDPGRIKREVKPLEEIGPSLEEGKRFTLAIDADWLDATGARLKEKHERSFRIGPPDRQAIEPREWKVVAPTAGRFGALRVTFPEPMDHALALRLVHVCGKDGSAVNGRSSLSDAEKVWTFTPSRPWQAGEYELVVPATLEDLAGNNVGKPFEVEMLDSSKPREVGETVRVPFAVK